MMQSLSPTVLEAAQFYERNYECYWLSQASGKGVVTLTAHPRGVCRFCEQSSPAVSFNKLAHAIPESIGNTTFFTAYECDACNETFGRSIENDFGNWSLPQRIVSQIAGKTGLPKMARDHLGWRIHHNANGLQMEMREDHIIFAVDEQAKVVTFSLPRDTFVPVAVFKTFAKMACSFLPEADVAIFRDTIRWIRQPDHSMPLGTLCSQVLYAFIPGNMPPDSIQVVLCRRRLSDTSLPLIVFILACGNYVYQMFLPCPEDHQSPNFTATVFPMLLGHPNNPKQPGVFRLGGTAPVRNETQSFVLQFEEMRKDHEDAPTAS